MNYIVSARTDIGISKSTNQDSLFVRVANTSQGRMTFAVLCDGMGGLSKGEVASASVISAFEEWFLYELPRLTVAPLEDSVIRSQWNDIVTRQNRRIQAYGVQQNEKLGTTVVAMLITPTRYYILNVGDSRAYEISDKVTQLTTDHTFVQREVALGRMTEEEARCDERSHILLQCVGASTEVSPDLYFGQTHTSAVYMLCSDGFRHVITQEEIYQYLSPDVLFDEHMMNANSDALIELNKMRMERDNISVALVRTF